MRHALVVRDRAASERLDVFLAAQLEVSRSQIGRLLSDGAVQVNGKPQRASYLVQPDDRISVLEPEVAAVEHPALDLPVVYEDADIIVIDKPAGLASHSGAGQPP